MTPRLAPFWTAALAVLTMAPPLLASPNPCCHFSSATQRDFALTSAACEIEGPRHPDDTVAVTNWLEPRVMFYRQATGCRQNGALTDCPTFVLRETDPPTCEMFTMSQGSAARIPSPEHYGAPPEDGTPRIAVFLGALFLVITPEDILVLPLR